MFSRRLVEPCAERSVVALIDVVVVVEVVDVAVVVRAARREAARPDRPAARPAGPADPAVQEPVGRRGTGRTEACCAPTPSRSRPA